MLVIYLVSLRGKSPFDSEHSNLSRAGAGTKKRTPVERLYNRIEPASDEPETITLRGGDLVPSVRGRSSRSKVGNFA